MNLTQQNFDKWKSRWVSSMLEIFILFSISQQERYGGELVQLSKKFVDEGTKVPTVYAIIKRYTSSNILQEYKVEDKSGITRGRSRIYYKLTTDGKSLLQMIESHLVSKQFLQTLDFAFLNEVKK